MDPSRYLQRIGHPLDVPLLPESLASLMDHHLRLVPFENLDIHLGVPISLDLRDMYGKIVARRRGGFCYELNGLFAWLLSEIGFEVDMLAARVVGSGGTLGIEYDHMVLLVHLEDDWLVDVGFGDSHRTPLRLGTDEVQPDPVGQFRVIESHAGPRLERRKGDGDWIGQFVFTTQPQVLSAYMPACRWQQTSPDSHFTQQRVATIALPDNGRLTYSGTRRIETTAHGRTEVELESEEAWWSGLAEELGISLDR
ncbi:MAG: arylamine N-acetyltransferase [Acidimicrobiia bacterium]|nr:arylamine N-acetyltransferase [Acidimicrobiia bacterium]